jgi:hypothetical protein
MASTVQITLDTSAPGGASVSLAGGAAVTSVQDIVAAIATSDADTTGYQVKIYGDVDDSAAPAEYRAVEGDAPWVSFETAKNIRISAGNGLKTVRVKIRDDVWNTTSELTDTITLDTSVPVITVTSGPTPARISKQSGKRTSSFTWQPDVEISEYKVKLVNDIGDPHTAGAQIGTTGGSTNVAGVTVEAEEGVTTQIDGADLETAGVNGSAAYNGQAGIVKVFGRAASNGVWSL